MDDEVIKRDTTAPTQYDRIDKSLLPAVMQVKNFGRAGRTKYTHLKDQDTSLPPGKSLWDQNRDLTDKMGRRMGGMDKSGGGGGRKRRYEDEDE